MSEEKVKKMAEELQKMHEDEGLDFVLITCCGGDTFHIHSVSRATGIRVLGKCAEVAHMIAKMLGQ